MIRLVLIFAILATVASAAIGSTLGSGSAGSDHIEATMVADQYAKGGSSWSLIGGITVIEKTGGCGSSAAIHASLGTPAAPVADGKGDKLATVDCAVVASN